MIWTHGSSNIIKFLSNCVGHEIRFSFTFIIILTMLLGSGRRCCPVWCVWHWLTGASAPQGDAADVVIYDSLYDYINTYTQHLITQLLKAAHSPIKCAFATTQRQTGVKDCGLFAIATATSILLWGMSKWKTLRAISDVSTFPSVPRKGRNDAIPE